MKRVFQFVVLLLAVSTAFGAESAPITLTNYESGTTIRYPVPLLRGTLADKDATFVVVVNKSTKRKEYREFKCLARKGKFIALTHLDPGENKLEIRCGKATLPLTLTYTKQTNPWRVRIFYLVDSSGRTDYQTPVKGDKLNWKGKLQTAALMMQTFTAERLNDFGYGRKTFNLEFDDNGDVVVHLLKAPKDRKEYYAIERLDMWQLSAGLLGKQYPDRFAKNLVVCSFTWKDAEKKKLYCHSALGGGNLAYFGGATMFTWPDSIQQIQERFMDATMVDPAKFFSDSVGRHTFWANASTTLGAALHELGHTFGLPHTSHPHDIMTRGHDRLNRVFTLVEPPHARRKKELEFKDDAVAAWYPVSADALVTTDRFQLDERKNLPENRTVLSINDQNRRLEISSPNGLRFVGLHIEGRCAISLPIDPKKPGPKGLGVSMDELAQKLKTDDIRIRVVDDAGNVTHTSIAQLLKGPFVTTWYLSGHSSPWKNLKKLVDVDRATLEKITAAAAKGKLIKSTSPMVDLLRHFPEGQKSYRAGYLVRKIRCDKDRKIRIFTGSDDALRIWINGKLVQAVPALRGAVADSESAEAELEKGENTMVVEVSQAGGGWALFMRLEDDKGGKLILQDDGRLITREVFDFWKNKR